MTHQVVLNFNLKLVEVALSWRHHGGEDKSKEEKKSKVYSGNAKMKI
jgi:hypothetical protein